MPATDLGAPAYRKVDIEAWMPGRDQYGEVGLMMSAVWYFRAIFAPSPGFRSALPAPLAHFIQKSPLLLVMSCWSYCSPHIARSIPPPLIPTIDLQRLQLHRFPEPAAQYSVQGRN